MLRRGAEVDIIGDEDNEFLPVRVKPDDLVVRNVPAGANSPERIAQTIGSDLPLPDLPIEQAAQQIQQQLPPNPIEQVQQKLTEDPIQSLQFDPSQTYSDSDSPAQTAINDTPDQLPEEWVFSAIDEWPETAWLEG